MDRCAHLKVLGAWDSGKSHACPTRATTSVATES
jgi:hypothetical protein